MTYSNARLNYLDLQTKATLTMLSKKMSIRVQNVDYDVQGEFGAAFIYFLLKGFHHNLKAFFL